MGLMMAEPAVKRRRMSPPADHDAGVPGFAKWDLEQDYEQRRRKKHRSDNTDKLLIKTSDGQVKENSRVKEQQLSDADGARAEELLEDEEKENADSDTGNVEARPAFRKPAISSREQVRSAKEELARIAGQISGSPEEYIGQLGTLAQATRSENTTVKKLALLTQLAVFKDIIPGYRIRPLVKDDLQGKISKEVKKLRSFEQSLLGGYKEYVETLAKLAASTSTESAADLAGVAIHCACTLLISAPHFNCRPELIAIVVRKLANRRPDQLYEKCREAVEQLFQQDEDGNASLDVVGQLTRMMKARSYGIHEDTLNVFLHLRLLNEFAHKASTSSVDKDEEDASGKKPKQKRAFRSKRERKVLRERKQVEKEMKEADATVSYEERDKNQAETLKLVFVAYFRILKARVQHLMGAVLEGLAKYSHLINQDFFGDILEALKDLTNEAEASLKVDQEDQMDDDSDEHEDELDESAKRNATRESLLCVITAFALLQGQLDVAKSASSLHLDLSFFITHLYRTLLPLAMDADIELSAKTKHLADPNGLDVPSAHAREGKVNVATTVVLLLRSLQSALLPPTNARAVPPVRAAAFVKQLMTLALQLPQKSAAAVLELLRAVTKTHAARVAALWHSDERRGDGVFDPLSREAESSNPFACTVWEGELLRLHFDPKVRAAVGAIEKNVRAGRS